MIGFIQGKLHSIGDNSIIILANGIGFEIEVHDRLFHSLPLLQQEISIYTYHHVREDQQTLFGFSNLDEKNVFKTLLKVSGVGPRLALAILSTLEANTVVNAILQEDFTTLKNVKGLGVKVAKRLIMDLKTPLASFATSTNLNIQNNSTSLPWQDAVLVLTRLGYKSNIAEKTVLSLKDEADDLDHLIRISLKHISKETTSIA
jgi:Holliday junction DNA helicase RuvA